MPTAPRRPIALLPNALTLANAGLGLLAICKAIDALASTAADPAVFDQKLETACWLILVAGIFDALDGKVARLTGSFSNLGAELDSLADALTFGVAPAVVAKVLLAHEGITHPRLDFTLAAAFALMAVLRLARFNAEGDDDHVDFAGLPTPAAAGMLTATVMMFLSVRGAIETSDGEPTFWARGMQFLPETWRTTLGEDVLLPAVIVLLPLLALLMVSRIRYVHLATKLGQAQDRRVLVPLVFGVLAWYMAPAPALFLLGLGYVGSGLVKAALGRLRPGSEDRSDRRAA